MKITKRIIIGILMLTVLTFMTGCTKTNNGAPKETTTENTVEETIEKRTTKETDRTTESTTTKINEIDETKEGIINEIKEDVKDAIETGMTELESIVR